MPKILIDEEAKKRVLLLLDRWKGKLTWDALAERFSREYGVNQPSRFTLQGYDEIKVAFQAAKKRLKANPDVTLKSTDKAYEKAFEYISELKNRNARLQQTLDETREQFVRWQNNLYRLGINMDELLKDVDRPLVETNRGQQK